MFEILFWHWWVVALALLIVELLSPGFFFLWMAVAALITGCLLLLIPALAQEIQFFLFSVLSVASIVIWRKWVRQNPEVTDHPFLNKRGQHYIGQVFTLSEPIINGRGRMRIGDGFWPIKGPDCAAGTRVRVCAVQGTVLHVETIN